MQCNLILILNESQYDFRQERLLNIVELDVLKNGKKVGHRIGDPVSLTEANKKKSQRIF